MSAFKGLFPADQKEKEKKKRKWLMGLDKFKYVRQGLKCK
jgi:hypothetical protein